MDYGATILTTARAVRIDEMIREKIESGKKMTAEDMLEIQLDYTDVFARKMVPYIVTLAERSKLKLS